MMQHVQRKTAVRLGTGAAALLAGLLYPSTGLFAQGGTPKPGASFNDCRGCPEMKVLPAGQFRMGTPDGDRDATGLSAESREVADAEGPIHSVSFARPFALSKYEVTQGEFAQFVKESGYQPGNSCWIWTGKKRLITPPSSSPPLDSTPGKSWQDPNYAQKPNHPAVCVTWGDANAYAEWLAKKTGKPYRLPSEAEWEYGARGGSTARYSFGSRMDDLCKNENVFDQTAKNDNGPTNGTYAACTDKYGMIAAPVGSFPANRFGLHDMNGNVSEWVADCYLENYVGAPTDGSAFSSGDPRPAPPTAIPTMDRAAVASLALKAEALKKPCMYHAIRGGNWAGPPVLTRPGFRHWLGMSYHTVTMGFRVARSL